MYKGLIKRVIDFTVALGGFLCLLPLFLFVVVALAIANRGKVFFLQVRPGLGEKPFRVIKFKTMNDCVDENGQLLPDDRRLTPVGRFVRKASLDEIPQLLNVIKGDMSLVGPRPLLMEYVALYNNEQRRRHDVRPGITGWAQINGRNAISWKKKFEYDLWYVDNISFVLDLKIILMTILKVVKSEGISGQGVATAEKFNGTN